MSYSRKRGVPVPRRARRGGIASAVVVILAGGLVGAGWLYQWTGLRDTGGASFSTALWVPPLLDPTDGRYPLELRTGTTELVDGRRTPTWGVNGAYLGPTL